MILLVRQGNDQFTISNVVRVDKERNPYRMDKNIIVPYVSEEDGEVVPAGEIDLTDTHVELLPQN